MKYTDEVLKKLGITYFVIYDEITLEPTIILKNKQSWSIEYRTSMTAIYDNNEIDNVIDKFIMEMRKAKLKIINVRTSS